MDNLKTKRRFHTLLIASSALHRKRSRHEFQQLNLSDGQPKVLSILLNEEGILQKDLAHKCHVEPATMTVLLSNMIKSEFIFKKRETVSGGKRAFSIYLTDKGHEMALKIDKIVDDMELISFQGFSENEKELFIELLDRIKVNLE